jgi:hypothetical protein
MTDTSKRYFCLFFNGNVMMGYREVDELPADGKIDGFLVMLARDQKTYQDKIFHDGQWITMIRPDPVEERLSRLEREVKELKEGRDEFYF